MVLHWIIFSVVLQIHTFEKSASFFLSLDSFSSVIVDSTHTHNVRICLWCPVLWGVSVGYAVGLICWSGR